jgi:CO/xanthine dehydrogenase Mo-binding subunit
MPVLCWDVVRFVGDRVAAVAAETIDAAEEALSLIDVAYEELPAVFDPLEAMQADAPRIHDHPAGYDGIPKGGLVLDVPNGLTRLAWRKGDIEQGFRQADLVLEHTFRIPGRHQGYIEPHAATIAIDSDGRIQVWASAKNPFGIRSQLAKAIGAPEERIRVNVVNVGGEFGGKGDGIDLPIAYFLAQRSGRPVKIVMSYAEELSASNPAHPTVVNVRSGVKRDGRIIARYLRVIHACGAYAALKPNAALATWHYAGGPYRVDNASIEFLQVYTNTVPGGYFRSPGSVQTFFALESHTDIIARELGMDPAEFRLRNLNP